MKPFILLLTLVFLTTALLFGCALQTPKDLSLEPPVTSPSITRVPSLTPAPFIADQKVKIKDNELYYIIAEGHAELFDLPDDEAKVLECIPYGDTVILLETAGLFSYVQADGGIRGYMLSEKLSGEAAGVPVQMRAGDIYTVYADEYLSLRVSADSSSERIKKLPSGSLLRILEADTVYARAEAIEYGLRGYVLTDYLVYANGRQEQPDTIRNTGLHAVICREFVSLREAPEKNAQPLFTLKSGVRVDVLSYEGAFAKVSVNQQEGYLFAEYITRVPHEESTPYEMYVVCEDYLSLRQSADSASPRIKKLSNGERVTILYQTSAFSHVRTDNGDTGFVLSRYLSDTKKCVEVPLAPQENIYRVVCNDYLTLRSTPSGIGRAIARLSNGTRVELISFDGLYAKVSARGQTGYVLAGYLKEAEAAYGLKVVKPVQNYSYKTMMADLEKLSSQYNIITLGSVGESVQGRDIPVVRIGNEQARYHILVHGGIHGREHMTSLLLTAIIEYTAMEQSATYAGIAAKNLFEDICLHIIPMVNPDGVTISQTSSSTSALKRIYESDVASGLTRLPLSRYLRSWKSNANGVDINRNFDAGWSDIDSPASPSFTRYKGEGVHDQPEAQALVNYTKKYKFDATISYHASGSVIFWQYGDNETVNAQSKDLGFALRACTQYPLAGSDGLDAGGYKDWAMDKMGIPSVTIEIGTRACPLPKEEFSTIWVRNKKVLLAAARWVKR